MTRRITAVAAHDELDEIIDQAVEHKTVSWSNGTASPPSSS